MQQKTARYYLNAQGDFIIENYNFAKPLANFLPGIAGKYGIPMWAFYVNRAQGMLGFGTKDKDHAISEFFPANKAWQIVSTQGFRTFLKLKAKNKNFFYEPFHNGFVNLDFSLTNLMRISAGELALEENNFTLGLQVKVTYFNIPNDCYAGLARVVSIKNLGRQAKDLQILDGLPQIIPFGTSNLFLKKLGRTIEAWMKVENLPNGVPFYRLTADPTDRPEVIRIQEGNFYLGFHHTTNKAKIICPIVDPQYIFGPVTDFSCPYQFLKSERFRPPKDQIISSKTPAAFLPLEINLAPQEEKTFYAVAGYMRNKETLNASLARITSEDYLTQKARENKKLLAELQADIETASASLAFDLYAKQTYLDNILRGGYPVVLQPGVVFYLYSRKHGDLERDYNKFHLQPSYFSQGNGNYRDINQNRRMDVWFNPEIKDNNLISFLNLLQTDGFNPLVVKGSSFSLKDASGFKETLRRYLKEKDVLAVWQFLSKPFTPGEVFIFLEENKIKLKLPADEFLEALISASLQHQEAEHGEGFWTDHWAYNLDLLEAYLSLYPEKLKELFFQKRVFTYYDNSECVKPRSTKYLLAGGRVKQLQAVALDHHKRELIHKRSFQPHLVRTENGNGQIYQTTLLNKLLCLLATKLASLDPFGVGIEMEANKPNWYDALNGLPALFGSSLCETLELKRLVIFVKYGLSKTRIEKVNVTEEVYQLLCDLNKLLQEYFAGATSEKDYLWWDKSSTLKEDYRQKTKLGLSGQEPEVSSSLLIEILDNALRKLELGIEKAKDKKRGIYFTYFMHEVKAYQPLQEHFAKPTKFVQKKLPLFLEGQMHALRLAKDRKEAEALFAATKASQLYDKKLGMYKVTASLKGLPEEVGRCQAFSPGWLENESVWLHMEYKYLLETLRQGLYEEFYRDFKNVLIPFQPAARYGRSILENSSFLVSSAFPDKSLHGNGFVARLSGSTSEFLQIWLRMNVGEKPFFLNKKNELNLQFSPVLAGWLFKAKEKTYQFNLLSKIRVTYHNPKRKNTFGRSAAKIKKIIFKDKNNHPVEIGSNVIPAPYAEQIRSRLVSQIDIYLA